MANRLDPSAQFALVAAQEAWADAGEPEVEPERFGVDFATGIGGLQTTLAGVGHAEGEGSAPRHADERPDAHAERAGCRGVDAPRRPRLRAHRRLGLRLEHRGARQRLRALCGPGHADVIIAGGTEAVIHALTLAAFASMQALSKRNDSPETASRPYSVDRDGFVMGEGAACLVLETEEHAKARGAKIYGEVVGGGVTADSYHITAPEPEGLGASRAVLPRARGRGCHAGRCHPHQRARDVDAHRRHRRVQGAAERLRRPHPRDPGLGHEGVDRAPARRHRRDGGDLHDPRAPRPQAPPTINLSTQDPEIPLRISGDAMPLGDGPQLAISNSFGFGGHNAVVAFRSV